MKRLLPLLLFLIMSDSSAANEGSFKSIQLSNLHIKVWVGGEKSFQIASAEAYAPLINNFIRELDTEMKVLIQFNEGVLENGYDYALLSIDSFKTTIIPVGFPLNDSYEMGFTKDSYGLSIIVSQKTFKLSNILNLIEYGIQQKETILKIQRKFDLRSKFINPKTKSPFLYNFSAEIKSIPIEEIEFSLKSTSTAVQQYLKRTTYIQKENKGLRFALSNDSVHIVNELGKTLLVLPSVHEIIICKETNDYFVFISDRSFYFIGHEMNFAGSKKDLTFTKTINHPYSPQVSYDSIERSYKISQGNKDEGGAHFFDLKEIAE